MSFSQEGKDHTEGANTNSPPSDNPSKANSHPDKSSTNESASKADNKQVPPPSLTTPNRAPAEELKPDAVAADGVLSLLNSPSPGSSSSSSLGVNNGRLGNHHRTLSAGSKAQIDAQLHQLRFQAMRKQLSDHLEDTVQMIKELMKLNCNASISVIPPDLTVLSVDVRLGASGSVSSHLVPAPGLIESRLKQVIQHAGRLQKRLADTASRVLVTGDLNAGKSSLCNALLRRPILPTDQQPCTDVFCEVVDYEKNHGIEEVHALRHSAAGKTYDRDDRESYDVFSLEELDNLVHESSKYKLLVIYVRDPRPASQSLLKNGVVDICLIDAPGLNVSAVTTTELFGRQEEIDLVIFVVSAENHFTQSAKEFVSDTAREKSLLFIAVNNFDRIRDKDRCRTRVLDQVAQLAPETHKGASDFVHFLSTNDHFSGGDDGGSGPDGDNGPDDNGNRFNVDNNALNQLESSLRNFVLDKRSESKLRPARTYLRNVLSDLSSLAAENQKQAKREIADFTAKLSELAPTIDANIQEYARVTDQIDRDIERLCHNLFSETDRYLTDTVTSIGESPVVEWPGLMRVFDYAEQTRAVLVKQVLSAVEQCESQARETTASAVDGIKQVGVLHVGEQPAFMKVFNKTAMFSRRKDNLTKVIRADFGISDLFDVGNLLERPLPVLSTSRKTLVNAATTNASWSSAAGGALGALSLYQGVAGSTGNGGAAVSLLGRAHNIVGSKRLVVPAVILAAIALGAWVIYELPRTIPRKLARKIAFEIDELGYVRGNAERIANECRKVLKYPAQDVRSAFQTRLEGRTRQRDDFTQHLETAEHILSVFDSLARQSAEVGESVRRIEI